MSYHRMTERLVAMPLLVNGFNKVVQSEIVRLALTLAFHIGLKWPICCFSYVLIKTSFSKQLVCHITETACPVWCVFTVFNTFDSILLQSKLFNPLNLQDIFLLKTKFYVKKDQRHHYTILQSLLGDSKNEKWMKKKIIQKKLVLNIHVKNYSTQKNANFCAESFILYNLQEMLSVSALKLLSPLYCSLGPFLA